MVRGYHGQRVRETLCTRGYGRGRNCWHRADQPGGRGFCAHGGFGGLDRPGMAWSGVGRRLMEVLLTETGGRLPV